MASSQFRDALSQIHRLFTVGAVAGLSDASLLRRFQTGRDNEAFGAIVARHGPMVLSVCQNLLRDPSDVEDAFQATFLILVRQAGRVRVDGSLGGWLYRVAYRVALRARFDGVRRRARERDDVALESIAGTSAEGPAPELHEEIARLPESYRRAVVLCDLQGMTQVQAARELRCGEATIRRRLAGAHERLRLRLERRGVAPLAALFRTPAAVPTDLVRNVVLLVANSRPASANVARLVAAVLVALNRARGIRIAAALILGLGMTSTLVALAAHDPPQKPDRPPVVAATEPKKAEADRPLPHWVHKTSDCFGETWACLDDLREFSKSGKKVSLHDPVAKTDDIYDGGDAIRRVDRSKATFTITHLGPKGKPIPSSVLELLYEPAMTSKRATEQERKTAYVFTDYEIETVNGRRLGRLDQSIRDALGVARVDNQTWYDLETKLPIRRRDRLQVAYQHEFQREFATTEFAYPATGPADLFALGVPRGTPVVETTETRKGLADLPLEIQRCIRGAAEALRRFPRDFRSLTIGSPTRIEYWSCPAEWMDLRSDSLRDGFSPAFDENRRPLHFKADNQGGWPGELEADDGFTLKGEARTNAFADRFPFDKAVNIALEDGKRTYHLTRFYVDEGKPWREELHVLGGSFDQLPETLENQWPYASWGFSRLSLPPAEPDTPPGQIVIKYEQPDFRQLFYCDPDRDFIAVKQAEWWKREGKWGSKDETRAAEFKQLTNGSWYVTRWDHSWLGKVTRVVPGGLKTSEEEATDHRFITITPLPRDQFPKEIFNGDAFVESARKRGAKIEVDR